MRTLNFNARGGGLLPLRSTADLAHRPTGPDEAGVVDLVLELLVAHREAEQPLQLGVRGAVAQGRLQVPLAPREEARAQLTVGRQADTVAGRAERLRHRIDESD